jgi:hypothetical protein
MQMPLEQYIELWITTNELHSVLAELKSQQLLANQDFYYAFIPAWENYRDGDGMNKSSVRFWFIDDRLNTWFQLKYAVC